MADQTDHDDEKTRTHLVLGEGAVVSHYKIVGKIGAGGMGEVYLARDPSLDRTVALKFLPVQYLADDASRERFFREAKSAARLNHPNVITVHEVSEYQGRLYIAMEHVEGQSLGEVISRGELAWTDVCDIATQLAEGLSAAHKAGIVHRDLKPSNIMINKDGRVKVLDFGLARRPSDEKLTQSSTTMGTFPYMSPEQIRGEEVDHRSDLFSLGTVLFELATGSRPFPGSNIAEVGENILRKPPRSPAALRSDPPAEFQHLLSKCFEKDPSLRYQTAEEMLADLKRLRRELQGGHPDLEALFGPRQRAHGAGTDVAGVPSSTIPALPPDPPRRLMVTLAVASLLCFVSLYLWTPPQLRPFDKVQLSPSQAERIARLFLTDQGVSLYGYRIVTEERVDRTLRRMIQKERIPAAGWADLAKWTSILRYEVLAASADHQDRYYLTIGPDGRMHRLRHVLRPDFRPDTLSASASAALAQSIAKDLLGIDTAGLEELPVNEVVKEGRLEREYGWRHPTPLAGGATARASVAVTGATLVRAESSLEFPPTLQRSVEGESDDLGTAMFILMVAGLLVTLVVVVRQGAFVWPGVGLYLFFLVSTVIVALGNIPLSFLYAEGGIKGIAGNLVFVLLVLTPVLCLAATLLVALSHAALRTHRPQLIPGLSEALRGRIAMSVWIRSGAVGLVLGAVVFVLENYSTAACLALAGIRSTPRYESGMSTGLFEVLGKHVVIMIALFGPLIFAGLAVAVVLQRLLRLGRWMPPVLVLFATLLFGPDGVLGDLGPMGFLPGFLFMSVLFWACFRFGVLAGIICTVSAAVLSLVNDYLAVEPSSFRILGGAFLLLWLVSTGICLQALFKKHLRVGKSRTGLPGPR